ncbi:hypothetical protein VHEMI03730 [[Torrubiella] hemipterigena]|uniref:EF hand domain protein n=1 Tax=[Torrubiella] hemipterigena TaxID=1531966 RepID=A0A0A1STF0_9HYPO|nr:hypothetical protein VHEMI03730 [[Torrubiella] hemipterigena]
MWFSTPTVDSLTRTRLAVATISLVAAVSAGYYAYQAHEANYVLFLPPGELHRTSSVRSSRRGSRRNRLSRSTRARAVSSSSSEEHADENAENAENAAAMPPPATDNGMIVDQAMEDVWNENSNYPAPSRAGQNIVNLLFRLSEDNARRNGCVHRGCQCNACGMVPIRGVRYRCANCADFDLCETCESQGVHIKTHIFYKIRVPAPPFGPRYMQPVWYTGDPDTCRRTLPRPLLAKLSQETGFERPELEAFWEQWTYMANTEWREDPDELCIAMDRKTFERCLVPTGGSRHAAPNLIHDRMFAFYDSNHDDLIGFSEFLHGLSYRKRKDKLHTVFDGYDIDGDGLVDRQDFLRMFRAYYVLYKQMHRDILDGLEDQLLSSTEVQQLVNSRQPLSSLFGREGRLPLADIALRFEGKNYNADGSVDIMDGYESATKDNQRDIADRQDILTSLFACDSTGEGLGQRGYVTGSDADENWRTVRRSSGADADRTYWVTLMDPPATMGELQEAITREVEGRRSQAAEAVHDDEDAVEPEQYDHDEPVTNSSNRTDSAERMAKITQARLEAPKLEKRRRDMARQQLHERWRRRQFYLDQEEGGVAPEDWEDEEDVILRVSQLSREAQQSSDSQSDSKPATPSELRDPLKMRAKAGARVRQTPTLPEVERDAGKEILYQVTQQAFNELLDAIFKPVEDLAVEASETKDKREKYREQLDAIDFSEVADHGTKVPMRTGVMQSIEKTIEAKSLDELLAETGYTVADDTEHRDAVDLTQVTVTIHEDEPVAEEPPPSSCDPTLPQFRPNSVSERVPLLEVKQPPVAEPVVQEEPTQETLLRWRRLDLAELVASRRGGWGKLEYEEFEQIYRMNETQGNRLDYLGSWIDFCIP